MTPAQAGALHQVATLHRGRAANAMSAPWWTEVDDKPWVNAIAALLDEIAGCTGLPARVTDAALKVERTFLGEVTA